jgi:hypothetical protein
MSGEDGRGRPTPPESRGARAGGVYALRRRRRGRGLLEGEERMWRREGEKEGQAVVRSRGHQRDALTGGRARGHGTVRGDDGGDQVAGHGDDEDKRRPCGRGEAQHDEV